MTAVATARVYLEDTDAGGIVYHTGYLRFMERARTETLRAAGVQQSSTFNNDLSFVVTALEVQFLSPARLDDDLEITCLLAESRGARLDFTQEVRGRHCSTAHCRATVHIACVSLETLKPKRVPKEILERLEATATCTSS